MRVLVVDDNPLRHEFFDHQYQGDEVVHAYGYYEATDALTGGPKFDLVQLDHDLGDHREPDFLVEMYGNLELTGYHVAHFMANELEFKLRPDRVIVHSVNPDGAASIERLLERHRFNVCRIPFLLSETSAEGRLGDMTIELSNIVTAFDKQTIGTKVTDHDGFWRVLTEAVGKHDFAADRVPGQGFIVIPEAVPFVSAGVGPRTGDPDDYVCRVHRGVVSSYLRRQRAAEATGCAAVVYTREAYLKDPDVLAEPAELARIEASRADYVLVAVLAFAGPKTVLPLYRFVANLAGGNLEAQAWTADEIRAKAKEVIECENAWCTVAD